MIILLFQNYVCSQVDLSYQKETNLTGKSGSPIKQRHLSSLFLFQHRILKVYKHYLCVFLFAISIAKGTNVFFQPSAKSNRSLWKVFCSSCHT